jgi:hypothetical protein
MSRALAMCSETLLEGGLSRRNEMGVGDDVNVVVSLAPVKIGGD